MHSNNIGRAHPGRHQGELRKGGHGQFWHDRQGRTSRALLRWRTRKTVPTHTPLHDSTTNRLTSTKNRPDPTTENTQNLINLAYNYGAWFSSSHDSISLRTLWVFLLTQSLPPHPIPSSSPNPFLLTQSLPPHPIPSSSPNLFLLTQPLPPHPTSSSSELGVEVTDEECAEAAHRIGSDADYFTMAEFESWWVGSQCNN
jgi:hypothetical protein